MYAFPILAIAFGLIVFGRLGDRLNFEERRRDRIVRRALFYAGILILIVWVGAWFI